MPLPLSDQIMVFSADTGHSEPGTNLGAVLPSFTDTERDAISSPKDGAMIFNTTDNEMQLFFNDQWNGSVYGEMFQVNNIVATTINTMDVFEDVVNFSTGEMKETAFASSTLTTGQAGTYLVTFSACIENSTNVTYEMAVKIDGTVRDESHTCATIATGGNDVSMSGSFILTIAASKDIKLVIANKTNTANPTIIDASVNIVRIR